MHSTDQRHLGGYRKNQELVGWGTACASVWESQAVSACALGEQAELQADHAAYKEEADKHVAAAAKEAAAFKEQLEGARAQSEALAKQRQDLESDVGQAKKAAAELEARLKVRGGWPGAFCVNVLSCQGLFLLVVDLGCQGLQP